MNIEKIIIEFKGTTFHENYRAEDWLLRKLNEIKKEHMRYCDQIVIQNNSVSDRIEEEHKKEIEKYEKT